MRNFWVRKDVWLVICSYAVHASVYASQVSLWSQLQSPDTMVDLFINLMSAACAAMASTAFRLKSMALDLRKVFIELTYGVIVGVIAGFVTYALAEAVASNKFLQLALVTLAGWGGSKVMESWSAKYFGAIASDIKGDRK